MKQVRSQLPGDRKKIAEADLADTRERLVRDVRRVRHLHQAERNDAKLIHVKMPQRSLEWIQGVMRYQIEASIG